MAESEKIDLAEIEHVARLARIQLTESEKEKFGGQLSEILKYMEKLNQAKVDKFAPLSHILPLKNVTRPDEAASPVDPEAFLRLAPEREEGFFKVPPVIEQP